VPSVCVECHSYLQQYFLPRRHLDLLPRFSLKSFLSYHLTDAAVDVLANAVAFVERLKGKRRLSGEGGLVGDVREEDVGSVAWMSELVTASRMISGGRLKQALVGRPEAKAWRRLGKATTSLHLIRLTYQK
jgi:hypothetical protein